MSVRQHSYSPGHSYSSTGQHQEVKASATLRALLPYFWRYRARILLALLCLFVAKVANVGVPMVFKEIVDGLSTGQQALAMPALLLLLYGVMRFAASLFAELRGLLFARATQEAIRTLALEVFRHLHQLSLRFHLERQTGGLTRDIERGTRSIGSLINYSLYTVLPTIVEILLVLGVLAFNYDYVFAAITVTSLAAYAWYTIKVTEKRTHIRRELNEADSMANVRAVDSLLNYETVKYFNNEQFEANNYNASMLKWADAATRSQITLTQLNLGQQLIIALGVTAMMWYAAAGVVEHTMTLGDLVLVNALLIQLYMPLNFLGSLYREIRQALTDVERMFVLLQAPREVEDAPDARHLEFCEQQPPSIVFESVNFSYEHKRQVLFDVSFHVPAGKRVAAVGHSGAGKSTLSRLLYRFYDVSCGSIKIDGHDLRALRQESLRAAIGLVPQDTVLFNDSIFYNIRYGRPDASEEEVYAAARKAQLHEFISSLPQGYQSIVGERGLKLSGGEKQRVAIARALLKHAPVLIFDEATSALDSKTEKAIQAQLEQVSRGHTTLVIAHRLSTIMHADEILVMDGGRIVERGRHAELLATKGSYARMWELQQQEQVLSHSS